MTFDTYYEMDTALSKLHSPSLVSDETKVLGPFGVFQNVVKSIPENTPEKLDSATVSKATPDRTNDYPTCFSPLSLQQLNSFTFDDYSQTLGFSLPTKSLNYNAHTSSPSLNAQINEIFPDTPHNDHLNSFNPPSSMSSSSKLMDLAHLSPQPNSDDLFGSISNLVSYQHAQPPSTHSDFPNMSFQGLTTTAPASNTNDPFSINAFPNDHLELDDDEEDSLIMIPMRPMDNSYLSYNFSYGIPTHSSYFSPEARHLLHHFIRNVSPLMSFLSHESTPWKTIYLPRAIDAIGNLTAFGKASPARNTVLHAFLSVSSYHLAGKYPANSPQRSHFYGVGKKLKKHAVNYINKCLTNPVSFSKMNEEHKDMITAVLSMVATGVVSSQMNSSQFYMQQCRKFITAQMSSPPSQITKEVRVLHRIYSFLNLLLDSTNVTPNRVDSSVFEGPEWDTREEVENLGLSFSGSFPGSLATLVDTNSSAGDSGSSNDNITISAGALLEWQQDKSKEKQGNSGSENSQLTQTFHEMEIISTHSIYGIPDSLTILFNRAVRLARQKFYIESRRVQDDLELKVKHQQACKKLGEQLESWLTSFHETSIPPEYTNHYKKAFCLHTIAFYHSVCIYFYTTVCEHSSEKVRQLVKSVLSQMAELLQFNNRSKHSPVLLPVTFPLFIASCEATTEEEMLSAEMIFESISLCGFGTYTQTKKVVKEVWRRRSSGRSDCKWYQVIDDLGVTLLLS